MSSNNLLVELFVEELPPKALKRLGESFADTLRELLDRSRLQDMAVKARALARPDATGLVVNAILRGNA